MENLEREIFRAAKTSLIDRNEQSPEILRPRLIINKVEDELKTLTYIVNRLEECDEFWFSAAFLTNSGVACLYNSLKIFSEKINKKGKVLVSDYLYFTQPEALKKISSLPNIKTRLHREGKFHGKGYLFRIGKKYDLLIGSSNLTSSALCSNKELNLHVSALEKGSLIEDFKSFFEESFNEATKITKNVIKAYEEQHNSVSKNLNRENIKIESLEHRKLEPNLLQYEAIKKINKLRKNKHSKALVVSATGTGKTILSALDVKNFNAKKVLFVVHRNNIAMQAMRSFKEVFGKDKTMGIYSGKIREINSDFTFSTIQTISKDSHLKNFKKNHFDYIIIDETHRAGAESYKKIINYFCPKFLLGMTATPERTDGYDIFKIFNYNIACEIRLHRAMKEELLSEFHYFGITDITVGGKEINDLSTFNQLVHKERIKKIIKTIKEYGCDNGIPRGLIFCSRVEEAEILSDEFNKRGIKSISLSGNNSNEEREDAIKRLESDDPKTSINYIFTVDVFNEGIDIPKINQIIMLRPTQSPIIFVQQLGRGLRKDIEKDYLTVIDFIGNYSNNYMIPIALYGDSTLKKDSLRKLVSSGSSLLPGASTINFDEITKNKIYESIDKAKLNRKKDLLDDYNLLKFRIGRIPLMTDFLEFESRDPFQYVEYSNSMYEFSLNEEDKVTFKKLRIGEKKLLGYLSRNINNGKRAIESFLLKLIIENGNTDINNLKKEYKKLFPTIKLEDDSINSALNSLNLLFHTEKYEKSLLPIGEINDYEILTKKGKNIRRGKTLKKALENETFKTYLLDSVKYSLSIFSSKLERSDFVDGFIRYEKYSRGDVFRILNWKKKPVEQNVGGYMVSSDSKNCAIFVTYNKKEGISETTKYEDKFLNEAVFTYKTKSQRTIESREVKLISAQKENNVRLPLFLKKSDDEGIEHYYIGELYVIEESIKQEFMQPNKKAPVVTFSFQLDKPVEENLYKYIVK